MGAGQRQTTRRILVVWTASWLLAVLQPCCEVVAAALPHEHGDTDSAANYAGDHDHAPAPRPEHCSSGVADLELDGVTRETTWEPLEPGALFDDRGRFAAPNASPGTVRFYSSVHPPPDGRSVYLRTGRLRI